jgi:hypothetical protein
MRNNNFVLINRIKAKHNNQGNNHYTDKALTLEPKFGGQNPRFVYFDVLLLRLNSIVLNQDNKMI